MEDARWGSLHVLFLFANSSTLHSFVSVIVHQRSMASRDRERAVIDRRLVIVDSSIIAEFQILPHVSDKIDSTLGSSHWRHLSNRAGRSGR